MKEERYEKVVEYDKEWRDVIVYSSWIFIFELILFILVQSGDKYASRIGIFFNVAFILLLVGIFFAIRKVYWRKIK